MDETFISNDQYPSSPMSDQHSTATISEKIVDVSNIGTFVMGEHNSSMITFQIERYYDGVDLSDKKIKIVYKNSNGIYESDDTEICNVKYSQKSLRFSWIVSSNVTQTSKFVAYVCFVSDDYLMKTENFTVLVKSSFDPSASEPSANWFVTIEGKLEKIEKDIVDNHVYDWAKQPEKPTYTPEEIGAEKAGTSDGIFRSAMKYTDGEISRLEDTVIPDNVATLEQKITDLNQSVVNLQDAKAKKVHTHLVADITDFPTSLPASDVHDWAKAETKPIYTYDEVGALSSSTHIPSTLAEMTEDDEHKIITSAEREKWNAKSDFSGSYNDLTDVPEIKQLTDDLKEKYDNAATLATANKNTLDTDYAQTKEFLDGLKKGYIEYQLTWIENERITSENGEIQAANGWKRTAYTDICDAAYIFVTSLSGEENVEGEFQFCGAWYDENHKFIEELSLQALAESAPVPPATAKYFILSYNQLLVGMMIGRRASIQEGRGATASGTFSHAEGSQTTASGSFSHVEGSYSTASGDASHAEGDFAKAIGYAAHAEGMKSHAEGENSHAEGLNTYTKGRSSHAEGADSSARGEDSHAEGYNTEATGNQSHAEGNSTTASKVSSHAEGDSTNASGDNSHAEGKKSTASGAQSHAEGISTRASGEDSHAEGSSTIASQMCAHAEGGNTQAIASVAHAEGGNTIASGMAAHAEGNQTTASGPSSHSEGMSTSASGEQSHAEGVGTKAIGNYAHAEGAGSIAQNMASHAEGTNTKALGMYSHAEGYLSEARNDYAHAEGCETIAIDYAHAEGNKSQASGKYSHAEGNTTTASSDYAHAEGNGSTASGECAHAEGDGATASGNYSHAEGINTLSKGMCSHVEGASTTASGAQSHAEGSMTHAEGEISHAEGTNSHAVGSVSHAEGTNTLAEGESSHAEGSNTEAKGKYSHASGFCTQATHSCQYAVGCGNDPQADSLFEVGNGLNAEGNLIDDTTTLFDLKTRRNAFRVTNTGYAIAQTALQIGETAITEDQLKQLIQLITNAG
ncbi:hypothetical protein LI205_02890 [bacterium MSK18_59]|nr:hypothetical protein [bacterium MSK18_59]